MQDQNREQPLDQIYKTDSPKKDKKKRPSGLKIWIIIFLCIIALGTIIGFAFKSFIDRTAATIPTESYVGVLYVEGVIAKGNVDTWGRAVDYQHDFTINAIDNLILDNNNTGLILYVDSPGGGVYESDELYFKIKEYQETTGRPVYSYMASMAASGGYYISAPADMIFANRNCWTGSIGVTIGTLYDLSGFLEKHGISTVTISSGRNKSMGSIVDPLTDEQREIFQSLIDEAYIQFVDIVADDREMDIDKVIELADGRIYTARQALELKLIDGISSYGDAINHMIDTYGLEDSLIYDIRYHDTTFIGMLFNKLSPSPKHGGDVEAVLSLIRNDVEFPISYLCQVLKTY